MVNSQPSKQQVVWQSMVNMDTLKAAIQKLKEINWLYKDVDENDLDNISREVIETVSNTTSEKADKQDVAGFQSFTIRAVNAKHSTTSDIDQYKLLNIKEDALDNRQKCLDVMCFPTLFPTGWFGEHYPREVKITYAEYAKSRLLKQQVVWQSMVNMCQEPSHEPRTHISERYLLMSFIYFGIRRCVSSLLVCTIC